MKISEEIRVNVNAVKYSYCGKFLAFGHIQELTVLRTHDEVIVLRSYCRDKIKTIDWSFDSDHVLCLIANINSVEVFSVGLCRLICVIQDGTAGLHSAVWSPTACHIVTVAQFAVRLTVWSLVGRSVAFIRTPFMKTKDKLAFSSGGKYLAVTTGKIHNYKISIFSTTSWILMGKINCSNKIKTPSTPLWSPNNFYIAIWQTINLSKTILEIYSVQNGKMIGNFKNFQKTKLLGICSVAWCPNAQFLLVGCRDERIYVLNYITWSVTYVFEHRKVIQVKKCRIFHDVPYHKYILYDRPVTLTSILPSIKPFRLPEIANIVLSHDGLYAASQSKLMPAVVWIWSLKEFCLIAVIILKNGVTDLKWSYSNSHLLICTKSNEVSIWKPNGPRQSNMAKFGVKSNVQIQKGCWCPFGTVENEIQKCLIFTSFSFRIVSNF